MTKETIVILVTTNSCLDVKGWSVGWRFQLRLSFFDKSTLNLMQEPALGVVYRARTAGVDFDDFDKFARAVRRPRAALGARV